MSSTAAPASHIHRTPRVLACVLCQHRKIKCDRNSPCSNCIKANVTCTPSTPAPARKRRRPNQDLQERLARCEELLKQYANGTAPVQRQMALPQMQTPSSPTINGLKIESATSTPASVDSQPSVKPACVMVQEHGNVRYVDSYIWASVYDELRKMRDIVETDDPEDSSVLGSEEMSPDNNTDLFLSGDASNTNLEDLQPDPVHIFRLWQLFLDRVNPLTKIIHVPSMQRYVMEAATNMSSLPLNYQALLFSIFTMAAISMSPIECIQILGVGRETAIQRFNSGTKAALIKSNFLKNYNMTSLQALVLYLITLDGRYDRDAQWLLSGTAVRIAQKMGYHRDGEKLDLTPFETEMRRRIWWQIIMMDSKYAMVSGLNQSGLPPSWDTKTPLNLNDTDLYPGSNEPVVERDGPTEMAFCLITHEICRFKMVAEGTKDGAAFEAAFMGQTMEDETGPVKDPKAVFERFRAKAKEMENRLIEMEEQIVDVTAGNVHVAALSVRPMLILKLSDMLIPMNEQPEWGTEIFGPKDNFFKVLIMVLEHKSQVHQAMAAVNFNWFMRLQFQLDIFAVFTGLLHDRPMGSLADRAWEVMEKIYAQHTEILDMSVKQHVAQAQFTIKAWKAREAAFAQAGRQIETPDFILRLKEIVPSHDSRSSGHPSVTPPTTATPQQNHPMPDFNQVMGSGYLDVSSMNWEIFGDFLPPNGDQLSAAMFDGYGLGNINMGSMG